MRLDEIMHDGRNATDEFLEELETFADVSVLDTERGRRVQFDTELDQQEFEDSLVDIMDRLEWKSVKEEHFPTEDNKYHIEYAADPQHEILIDFNAREIFVE